MQFRERFLRESRVAASSNFLRKLEVNSHGQLMYGGTYRRIDNVDETFGGHFHTNGPLPSRTYPRCEHGDPPSWARSG